MSRRQLERSGYLKSFPHFLGCICCLGGSEADVRGTVERFEAGEDWTDALSAADLVLTPAACYPVYPIVASRGEVPAEGLLFDVASDCFRREPSRDIDRLQSFRMREYVCVGTRANRRFPNSLDGASARPRQSAGIAVSRRSRQRRFLWPRRQAHGDEPDRAGAEIRIARFGSLSRAADRLHEFQLSPRPLGTAWNLHNKAGAVMNSGCVAFGMDRLALALFATHGLETSSWPEAPRKALGL